MALRATVAEVKEIIETDLSDAQITASLTIANILVTAGPAASKSPALGSDHLKEIERWLAAHFVCIRDPVSLRAKLGEAESWNFPASVTVAWGKGLNLTPYGQQAVGIDLTGELAKLGMRQGKYKAARREDSDFYTERLTKS